jgi:hypothetical protein
VETVMTIPRRTSSKLASQLLHGAKSSSPDDLQSMHVPRNTVWDANSVDGKGGAIGADGGTEVYFYG